MADLTKRAYGGQTLKLQGDIDRALSRIRGDLSSLNGEGVAYTPADPDLWDPAPSTVQEALDRIVRWLRDRHGGDMPIGE